MYRHYVQALQCTLSTFHCFHFVINTCSQNKLKSEKKQRKTMCYQSSAFVISVCKYKSVQCCVVSYLCTVPSGHRSAGTESAEAAYICKGMSSMISYLYTTDTAKENKRNKTPRLALLLVRANAVYVQFFYTVFNYLM